MPDLLPRTCTRRTALAVGLGASVGLGAAAAPARTVRLARPHFRRESTGWYPMQVLEAALAASGSGWTAQPMDRMTDARALIELTHPQGLIDVVVGMPNRAREAQCWIVPAPLYLGLFGWRALVVRRGEAQRWRGLRSVADLRGLRCFQGQGWPDTDILRHNGVPVVVGGKVSEMYERLRAGEGDAFPRGVTEAWGEIQPWGDAFEVVPEVVLHYRSDLFFFLRRDDQALGQVLKQGLDAMHRSQALHRGLLKEHGVDLQQAQLGRRRVIDLDNPELSPALRALPTAWWTPPRV